MKINRNHFLLLTGTIAGTACVIREYKDPNAPAGTVPAATTPPPAPVAGGPAPRHITLGNLGAFHWDAGAPPPVTPPPPAPAACLDDGTAGVSACTLNVSSCSEGLGTWAKQRCTGYATYFKPKVAAVAVSCMTSSTTVCAGTTTNDCGLNALKQACTESNPQWQQACAVIAATPACKATSADCMTYFSGLNDNGKKALSSCASEGGPCVGHSLYACVEGLLGPQ